MSPFPWVLAHDVVDHHCRAEFVIACSQKIK
jgi:hypothetical protein